MAAEQGLAQAQHNLGVMYVNGEGVPQNSAEAARWSRMAAEQGLAQAQFNLGLMYAKGDGVPKDHAEAVRWYRMAAEQGDAKAQYNLGVMYVNGEGVPQESRRGGTVVSHGCRAGVCRGAVQPGRYVLPRERGFPRMTSRRCGGIAWLPSREMPGRSTTWA